MGEPINEDKRNLRASESARLPGQGDDPEKAGVLTRLLAAKALSSRLEASRKRLPDSKARPGRAKSTRTGAELSGERLVRLREDMRRESTASRIFRHRPL